MNKNETINMFDNVTLPKIIAQINKDLKKTLKYSHKLEMWFFYEFQIKYIWSPIPTHRLIGKIQDEYIIAHTSYDEQNYIKSLQSYSLAKQIEKSLRFDFDEFHANNDLFIGNNKIYFFKDEEIIDIPKNVQDLNIINYIPYTLKKIK